MIDLQLIISAYVLHTFQDLSSQLCMITDSCVKDMNQERERKSKSAAQIFAVVRFPVVSISHSNLIIMIHITL